MAFPLKRDRIITDGSLRFSVRSSSCIIILLAASTWLSALSNVAYFVSNFDDAVRSVQIVEEFTVIASEYSSYTSAKTDEEASFSSRIPSKATESIKLLMKDENFETYKERHTGSNHAQVGPFELQTPALCYSLSLSGLGSQLVNMFTNAAYFKDTQSRNLCAIESGYGYRQNASVGVLTGFFTPGFPVIDVPEQHSLLQPLVADADFNVDKWVSKAYSRQKVREYNDQQPPLMLVDVFDYHRPLVGWYKNNSATMYGRLVQDMCPHLQFNEPTKERLLTVRKEGNIPEAFNAKDGSTIGFHIRRGDKLISESRKYEAIDYLKMFEQKAGLDAVRKLKHCFVASDDPEAVQEFRDTVAASNKWSCTVHSFSNEQIEDTTFRFMAELSVLIDATYFVGTFTSNVGSLVSILRSCPRRFEQDFAHDNYFHYGQSYGADWDGWVFW